MFRLNHCLFAVLSEDSNYRQFFEPLSSTFEVFESFFITSFALPRLMSTEGFFALVGRARLELATNGLKVRCSTD